MQGLRQPGWELTAHPRHFIERHSAGEYAQAIALPEESPFGRLQTLKGNRLSQPAALKARLDIESRGARMYIADRAKSPLEGRQ